MACCDAACLSRINSEHRQIRLRHIEHRRFRHGRLFGEVQGGGARSPSLRAREWQAFGYKDEHNHDDYLAIIPVSLG